MAKEKKKRLFKLASEINIGKDAIVSYLDQKGYKIENKPTAMLTEEMVNVVYSKFKREMRAIEVQREKIEKVKVSSKATSDETDTETKTIKAVAPTTAEPIAPEKQAVAKEIPSDDKTESKPKEEPKLPEKPVVKQPVVAGVGDVVGDVIDLGSIKKAPAPSDKNRNPRQTAAPVRNERSNSQERPDRPERPERPNRTDRPERQEHKSEQRFNHKAENKSKPAPRKTDDYKKVANKPKSFDKSNTAKKFFPKYEEKPSTPRDIVKTSVKKEVAPEAVKSTPEMSPDDPNQLKGLTVLGKIDIRPRRSASAKSDQPNRKTRKRRITKVNSEGGTGTSSGNATGTFRDREQANKNKKHWEKTPYKGKPKSAVDASKTNANDRDKDKDTGPYKSKAKKSHQFGIENRPIVIGNDNSKIDRKKRRKKRGNQPEKISKSDIDKAVRLTMMEMESSSGATDRQKMRSKRKAEKDEKNLQEQQQQQLESKILKLTEFVTTSDLATQMDVDLNEVILKCMELGLMVTINQRLDKDTIMLIADDYGFEVEFVDEKQIQFIEDEEDPEETLQPRSPIVTIMGHVDHGKTSLLDHIRKANVVASEAGGITQHIGAYTVDMGEEKSITFLDTPGHEAFTAMRARGAQVTDIVVLIVAADDSVMPQTIEAISHSKAADVPIIVAINKCDRPDSNPDRIRQQLTDHDVLVEDWGGKNQCAEISAKQGTNIDSLLEKILIESEMLDLKANPDRAARGIVIESNMSKGFGSVATVIVQKGTLKLGDAFVSGTRYGRVRALLDDKGEKVKEVGPSTPVVVIGYDGLAEAGDSFMTMPQESEARKIANDRAQLKREQELRQVRHITLDEISQQIKLGGVEDLNIVIKADVGGSAEALADSLLKLSTPEVRVNILHKGIGAITETDVMLAAASNGVVVGFNINPNASARKIAEREHVDIRRYDIIYDCINEVRLALEGLLAPDIKENVTAVVEVRQAFKISKVGTIAGCHVLSGTIKRNSKIRIIRDGFKVWEGGIASLKRAKDDAAKVDKGFECGIQLDGFNDIKIDDIIESFEFEEIKRTL